MNTRLHTCVLLCGLLLIAGCGGDDDPTDPIEGHPPAEMVDDWTFVAAMVDSVPTTLADALEWLPQAVAANLTIQAHGAYVYEEVNLGGGQLWFETGYVYVEGGTVEFNAQMDSDGPVSEASTFLFTIAADTMRVQQAAAGELVDLTLVRRP